MENIIASWVYEKGELAKERRFGRVLIVMLIILLAGSFFVINYKLGNTSAGSIFAVFWFASVVSFVYLLISGGLKSETGPWQRGESVNQAFISTISSLICLLWLALAGLLSRGLLAVTDSLLPYKPETITFTPEKVSTEKKTWVLQDENRQVKQVELITPDKPGQVRLIITEKRKNEQAEYKLELLVPEGNEAQAKKLYDYFVSRVEHQA